MEDKRTRSDYIREIEQLKRVNKHYEKIHKELVKFIENEIEEYILDGKELGELPVLGGTRDSCRLMSADFSVFLPS